MCAHSNLRRCANKEMNKMKDNMPQMVRGLQHTQSAIEAIDGMQNGDTEIINATRDLKNARSRIIEVLRMKTLQMG